MVLLRGCSRCGQSYLDETDVGALLAEALTADVEAVLADETSGVGADAAVSTMLAVDLPYACTKMACLPYIALSSFLKNNALALAPSEIPCG